MGRDPRSAGVRSDCLWSRCVSQRGDERGGDCSRIGTLGIDLQVVSKQIVRCIAVVDHPYCWETLALLLVTFEEAGINLEIDPYTVVRPYVPDSKADTPPEQEVGVVGMEVV
mgnify:CR=1 FL=1